MLPMASYEVTCHRNAFELSRSLSINVDGILPDLPNIFYEDYRNLISYAYTDRRCVFDSNRARFVATLFCRNRSQGRYKFLQVVEPRYKSVAPRDSLLQFLPTTGNDREEKREETGLTNATSRNKGKGGLEACKNLRRTSIVDDVCEDRLKGLMLVGDA